MSYILTAQNVKGQDVTTCQQIKTNLSLLITFAWELMQGINIKNVEITDTNGNIIFYTEK